MADKELYRSHPEIERGAANDAASCGRRHEFAAKFSKSASEGVLVFDPEAFRS